MSNQHNEKEFEKIMKQVEDLDKQGRLETDIFTYEDRLGYHADDDRDEILFSVPHSHAPFGQSYDDYIKEKEIKEIWIIKADYLV